MADDNDLQALAGGVRLSTPTASGELVEISPLRVRQLAQVASAAVPLGPALQHLASGVLSPAELLALLAPQADAIAVLLAALLDKPRSWVDELELDDLVALLAAAIAVNADFFVRRLGPAIEKATQGLTSSLNQTAGSISPPG